MGEAVVSRMMRLSSIPTGSTLVVAIVAMGAPLAWATKGAFVVGLLVQGVLATMLVAVGLCLFHLAGVSSQERMDDGAVPVGLPRWFLGGLFFLKLIGALLASYLALRIVRVHELAFAAGLVVGLAAVVCGLLVADRRGILRISAISPAK